MTDLFAISQVALGGAIGASARFLMASFINGRLGLGFPWGTLLVNLVGCFGIGIAATLLLQRGDPAYVRLAPFFIPGILGGFTTFSAFTLETFQLMDRGRFDLALAYSLGSVGLGLAALVLGLWVARGGIQP